ncbi:hypothetical protein Hanom_Chr11g00974021 [Helianthus anomalus]
MARFQTFWIQMRKNKPLDESRKTGQTSGTKMAFYSKYIKNIQLYASTKKAIKANCSSPRSKSSVPP